MRGRFAAVVALGAAAGLCGCGSSSPSATQAAAHPASAQPTPNLASVIAPTGKLRAAIAAEPGFFAAKDPASGQLAGIAIDLGNALAARLGVPFSPTVYASFAQATAAVASGAADIAFVPSIPTIQAALSVAPPFLLLPHTEVVRSSSPYHSTADLDRAGLRIASVAGAGHTAALTAMLKQAKVVPVASDAAGHALLDSGGADAFADGRFALLQSASSHAGERILDDNFFVPHFAIAVRLGATAALKVVAGFTADEISSGAVKAAIDHTGLSAIEVAPLPAPAG
jgi:polar amino acid transport system substrate-binding protein